MSAAGWMQYSEYYAKYYIRLVQPADVSGRG
jgi:hypothetical protein